LAARAKSNRGSFALLRMTACGWIQKCPGMRESAKSCEKLLCILMHSGVYLCMAWL